MEVRTVRGQQLLFREKEPRNRSYIVVVLQHALEDLLQVVDLKEHDNPIKDMTILSYSEGSRQTDTERHRGRDVVGLP